MFIVREMQTKSILRYYFLPMRLAKLQNFDNPLLTGLWKHIIICATQPHGPSFVLFLTTFHLKFPLCSVQWTPIIRAKFNTTSSRKSSLTLSPLKLFSCNKGSSYPFLSPLISDVYSPNIYFPQSNLKFMRSEISAIISSNT